MKTEDLLTVAYVGGIVAWLVSYVALTVFMPASRRRPGGLLFRLVIAGGVGVVFGFTAAIVFSRAS